MQYSRCCHVFLEKSSAFFADSPTFFPHLLSTFFTVSVVPNHSKKNHSDQSMLDLDKPKIAPQTKKKGGSSTFRGGGGGVRRGGASDVGVRLSRHRGGGGGGRGLDRSRIRRQGLGSGLLLGLGVVRTRTRRRRRRRRGRGSAVLRVVIRARGNVRRVSAVGSRLGN